MSISNEDIIKLTELNNPSSNFNDLGKRFEIHKSRLVRLLELFEKKEKFVLDAIYFSDYKQSIIDKESKWNWKNPILIKRNYLDAIITMVKINAIRREEHGGVKFSDFIFHDLKHLKPITFKTGPIFLIENITIQGVNHISITLPIVKQFQLNDIIYPKNAISESLKQKHLKNGWCIFNLDYIQSIESDDISKIYAEIQEEFDKFIIDENIALFFSFFFRHTNTELNNAKIKFALWVMWCSLSVNNIFSFTYIPSIISVDNSGKQVSSGGLVLPQFKKEQSIAKIIAPLYQIINNWFSENAINDFTDKSINEARFNYQMELAHNINVYWSQVLNKLKNGEEDFVPHNVSINNLCEIYGIAERAERTGKIFFSLFNKKRGKIPLKYIDFDKNRIINILNDAFTDNLKGSKYKEIQKIQEEGAILDFIEILGDYSGVQLEESIDILLYNLIHNAIRYSKNISNFKLKINFSESLCHIVISNDSLINDKIMDSINNNFYKIDDIDKIGFGFTTIARIVDLIKELTVIVYPKSGFTYVEIKINL